MLHLADDDDDDSSLPKTAVYQDDFSPGRGNALQACVATLFHLPLDRVPNFVTLACGYEQGIRECCQASSASSASYYTVVKKKPGETTHDDVGKLCILRGKSPRGDFGHVVVARVVAASSPNSDSNTKNNNSNNPQDFAMVHDPHPEGTFLDENEAFGWCMFFEKSRETT